MSNFNDTMENAVRLAAFVEAKKKFSKTMSADTAADKAAELAKNLTVNFNRKGAKTQFINSLYAFFNASVALSQPSIVPTYFSGLVER